MLLNNILTWVITGLLFSLVISFYMVRYFGVVHNETISNLMKDFIDFSPLLLILLYTDYRLVVFFVCCVLANMTIYDSIPLGGVFFSVGYLVVSLSRSLMSPFSVLALVLSFAFLVVFLLSTFPFLKMPIWLHIGVCIYALITLGPCLYAFLITYNPGFILLVIGDSLLLLNQIFNRSELTTISDCFYFAGVFLLPALYGVF